MNPAHANVTPGFENPRGRGALKVRARLALRAKSNQSASPPARRTRRPARGVQRPIIWPGEGRSVALPPLRARGVRARTRS